MLAYQQLEDRLLVPRIYGATLRLPTIAVVLALSALPHQNVPLYPVMLAIFPLFWLSFHYGWRACSICRAAT